MDVTLVQECLHSRTKSSSNFYLTAFSYINKTPIYSLIICANVVFYNPLHGAPTFLVGGDKAHDISRRRKAVFFFVCFNVRVRSSPVTVR